MPAAASRQTLARQWELLKLLPTRRPGCTAAELLESLRGAGFKTTKRTVERDLLELESIFPLDCNEAGMPYRWRWRAGFAPHIPGMGVDEALTLHLVEDSIRPLLPNTMLQSLEPRFQHAREKLQMLADHSPPARWADKVASVCPELTLQPPVIDEECLKVLQNALLQDQQVSCRYYAAHQDQIKDYILNPLAMVQRGQVTYLLATAEPHATVLQFPLHRFKTAEPLDTPCRPEGFNLADYLDSGAMEFGAAEPISLKAWVSEWLVRQLQETPLSADMTLKPAKNGALLTATVRNSWALQFWILSYAGQIQVQQPTALRKIITQRLQAALELYQ